MKKKLDFKSLFLIIALIVILVAIYLAFVAPSVQLAPDSGSRDTLRFALNAIKKEKACDFLLNNKRIYDNLGNEYVPGGPAWKEIVATFGMPAIRAECRTKTMPVPKPIVSSSPKYYASPNPTATS